MKVEKGKHEREHTPRTELKNLNNRDVSLQTVLGFRFGVFRMCVRTHVGLLDRPLGGFEADLGTWCVSQGASRTSELKRMPSWLAYTQTLLPFYPYSILSSIFRTFQLTRIPSWLAP